ncbi:MAG: hypothetical protein ACQERF_09465 [Actinomycetota bacterium]
MAARVQLTGATRVALKVGEQPVHGFRPQEVPPPWPTMPGEDQILP